MKVRIRKEPYVAYERWRVETKQWWQLCWTYRDSVWGERSKEVAMELAKEYKRPKIEELK